MIDAREIRRLLPHRYPMLLVDRVLDAVAGESLTACKAITANEPWFAGEPVDLHYPFALLVESWGQSAALLASMRGHDSDKLMLFGSMSDVRFHRAVFPGEVLVHHVRVFRDLGETVLFEGRTEVAGETVVEVGRVVLAFRPAAELN